MLNKKINISMIRNIIVIPLNVEGDEDSRQSGEVGIIEMVSN